MNKNTFCSCQCQFNIKIIINIRRLASQTLYALQEYFYFPPPLSLARGILLEAYSLSMLQQSFKKYPIYQYTN